jgi:peptidoglycan hydrolase-like protein with peptidoglycan-binding domain
VRARPLTLPLIGIGLVALAACSTTSVTSAPLDETEATVESAPAETTATAPEPPTTIAESTVPVEESTTTVVVETTTTTAPAPVITLPPVPVIAATEPIAAVGSSSGPETARAQWRLLELGFWLQEPNGDFGLTTRQAVMAFQKYTGLPADGVIGEQTAAAMSAEMEKPKARADAGTLVEVDKSKQLLFFVIDGRTDWILNTSTGTEIPYEEPNKNDPTKIERGDSITPVGLHEVNRERAEGWWEGDLGEIYRPKYFVGGVAVHGSNSIPNYPASHGCVRVSVPAMDWIWESGIMPMDIPVWVHGSIPA